MKRNIFYIIIEAFIIPFIFIKLPIFTEQAHYVAIDELGNETHTYEYFTFSLFTKFRENGFIAIILLSILLISISIQIMRIVFKNRKLNIISDILFLVSILSTICLFFIAMIFFNACY
ncbi:MAG: hypothetical protein K6A63_04245 [Acholeplasmatales bacterium]|nr:hypothetical protein [Acholeplasmatales bacterium]